LLLVAQGCAGDDADHDVEAVQSASDAVTGSTEPEPVTSPSVSRDKAGNVAQSGPVTLTMAATSSPERPRGALEARFAEEVTAEGGPIAVDLQSSTADPIAAFTSGKVDMLLMPAQWLDALGVTSFRALSLPLLVDDDAQADRVATDSVVDTMMAGLDAIDATGLLFAPVAEQHLALQGDQPLRSLDQIAGGVRVNVGSEVATGVYQAMGTTAKYGLNFDVWDAAVQSGEVVAKEFPTALYGVGPAPAVMATNLTLYYEFAVLLIRNDALSDLSAAEADALRAAADTTEQRQIDERLREDEAFRNECLKGAQFSAAPLTLWAEIGRAVDDFVLEQLKDPATKDIYDAIKRAAGPRTLTWPNECHNGQIVPYDPPTTVGSEPEEGTYRVDGRTAKQLLASGVGAETATGNVVDYWELTLKDGSATLAFHLPDGTVVEQPSAYHVDADGYLVFTADPGSDGLNETVAWTPTEDGFHTEPSPTDDVGELNINYDVAGLGLFEFTRVG